MHAIRNFYLWLGFLVGACHGLEYKGGVYILQSHKDGSGKDIPLPEGQFELKVAPEVGNLAGPHAYLFSFKYGNLMTSHAVLLATGLTFYGFATTKMMPDPLVYQLELALKSILDTAQTLTITTTVVTIIGGAGSMEYLIVNPPAPEATTVPIREKDHVTGIGNQLRA
jgi:hypothetical protein